MRLITLLVKPVDLIGVILIKVSYQLNNWFDTVFPRNNRVENDDGMVFNFIHRL